MLALLQLFAATSTDCAGEKSQKLLGIIPKWYQYLKYEFSPVTQHCEVQFGNLSENPAQPWLIALAAIDILLRLAGLVAVGFVIYGGFRYVTSQGEPENTRAALGTVINALVGVGITIIAATIVGFIARRLGG